MALALNKERLALLYDFLVGCKPFCSWKNMPASADISFKVTRSKTDAGHYRRINGRHEIAISGVCCGWINELVRVMIHEMLHVHQATSGMETPHANHNAAFHKSAKRLCKHFGLDPHMF